MVAKTDNLPLSSTATPADQGALVEQVRDCFESGTPLYPVGGGTALDFGLPARQAGIGLSLVGLQRVIDYPARDMTVTVEAGLPIARLAELLAGEKQQLPIDVPRAGLATVGGVIASNCNGPRRYGYGSVRDYVIGIHAVDGRGTPFKGGGRVVKNVAGYDFCKLLTGSLGTLGVIGQVTLRLRPQAERAAWIGCAAADLDAVERILAALVLSEATPVAIEVLSGPEWRNDPRLRPLAPAVGAPAAWIVVGLEGTAPEVDWMLEQVKREWRMLGVQGTATWRDAEAAPWLATLAEFPQHAPSPLVLQASVPPSGTTRMMAAFAAVDEQVSLQCHAGNGLIVARCSQFPAAGLARTLVAQLQSVAIQLSGSVKILSNPGGQEMTARTVWGAGGTSLDVMAAVKRQFDPKNLLNPGRFVFP